VEPDAATTIEPKLRAIYLSEKVDDYTIENGSGDVLGLDGFTEEQLRVSLGAEIARMSTLANDMTLTGIRRHRRLLGDGRQWHVRYQIGRRQSRRQRADVGGIHDGSGPLYGGKTPSLARRESQ
jgi:hypothetical protein